MSSDTSQDLWPKWMWVAVPVLVVVVVAGLWWALFSEDPEQQSSLPSPSPTMRAVIGQPTQAPTLVPTLPTLFPSSTPSDVLPTPLAPAESVVQTPLVSPTSRPELGVGTKARVVGVGAGVLNVRDGAGTGYRVVTALRENAVLDVIGGPQDANNYPWWQVRNDAGETGWVAGEWLQVAD